MADSSFKYRNIFPGSTVLLFIPHEDDEINVAGATVYGLRREGYRVIVAFATNGDRSYLAETRIAEAAAALKTLGVPYGDIVLLGYPDGNLDASRSPYVLGIDKPFDADGHSETYGIEGKSDFAMALHGKHSPYTRAGFMQDVEDLIRHYRPESIIGVDFDTHPDHRACSVALETAVGHIVNEKGNAYFPLVLKEFAYNTGFESVADFYAPHFLSTVFNRERLRDPSYETDCPPYRWDERLRLPVAEACRAPLLQNNIIYKALRCHVSQRAFLKAPKVVNADQVFWLRRTDNLAMQGKTEVSSGNGDALHDFKLIDSADISVRRPVLDGALWEPEAGDRDKTARVTFDRPRDIAEVLLYGNVEPGSRVLDASVTFSNGYSVHTGPLPENGQSLRLSMESQRGVTWVEVKLLQTEGPHPGLTEWELFEKAVPDFRLLKILVDGNFAYDWDVFPGETPEIGVYSYPGGTKLRWWMDGKETSLVDINARAAMLKREAVIRVSLADDDTVYDEIRLTRRSGFAKAKLALRQRLDILAKQLDNQKIKRKHHQLRLLKRNSLKKLKK